MVLTSVHCINIIIVSPCMMSYINARYIIARVYSPYDVIIILEVTHQCSPHDVIISFHQLQGCRLAATGSSDQSHKLTSLDLQVKVIEYGNLRSCGEVKVDVCEIHLSLTLIL